MSDPQSHAAQLRATRATHLWRIWRTVNEMLADRGYEISREEKEIPRDTFIGRFEDDTGEVDRRKMTLKANPTTEMIKRDTPRPTKANPDPSTTAGTIWVEFCADRSVGIKQTRAFAHTLQESHYTTGIFITQEQPNAAALRAFDPLLELGIEAKNFKEEDLLVNITKHELVPRHILLSDEEKKVLLDRYRLRETQLPRIQSDDPVARYLGLRKGQVVKIIRKSETAGRYASYRWVYS
ncbi:DNA-directed RNA polymerases II 24 kDa polypeptide (RNA polymerase II subunit 5) [Exophiala xenobiotica]|uniref:DNA-directed RNA polymerases I, II, and III subunit RPABC1 n=1 Tax=Lithohypha guttulata TaxID=1690604 RepID=A0ABR0KHN4_9EURO|nr:DNA-directed RNA polymerases II 24 kDa polypeptide (RNA polymerase II subunit 5) [Lithohypha guttulata]KAK5324469.1 DNA-directed RNA polymerases II 24 kDa polypeptide (RNA polymerase II subunit 5) [Exophiala xenobiotica]